MKSTLLVAAALALGQFALPVLPAAAHGRCGDSRPYDGVVNVGDAVYAMRVAVGLSPLQAGDLGTLDLAPVRELDETTLPPTMELSPDGVIDIADVVVLLRLSVGLVGLDGCEPEPRRLPLFLGASPDRGCSGGVSRVYVHDPDGVGFGAARIDGVLAEILQEQMYSTGGTRWMRLPEQDGLPSDGITLTLSVDGAIPETTLTLLPPCDAAPVLVAVDPDHGNPLGATRVNLIGDGLQCASDVALVGTITGQREEAWIQYAPADEDIVALPFRVGSEIPQAFDIVVTTPCGTATLPGAFRFD